MKKSQQEYFECERFATDECPYREIHALKKRELLVTGDIAIIEEMDPDTMEEYIERTKTCGKCQKFVKKDLKTEE